jgi:hypothetical protein
MNLAKIKWEILDLLGYVFCEASFRWWDMFDDGSDLEDKIYHPTHWERLTYFIGVPSHRVGCFFYNLQNDEEAGVIYEEVISESR